MVKSAARWFLLGFGSALLLVVIVGIVRGRTVNWLSRLTGYAAERGILETRVRFSVVQDGKVVGHLAPGVRLELAGNTDKMTRFVLDIAWPETGLREQYFSESSGISFLELIEDPPEDRTGHRTPGQEQDPAREESKRDESALGVFP